MELPDVFTRNQVGAAFEALGLDDPHEEIVGIEITGTEIEVRLAVRSASGAPIYEYGELATVYVTIPVAD